VCWQKKNKKIKQNQSRKVGGNFIIAYEIATSNLEGSYQFTTDLYILLTILTGG